MLAIGAFAQIGQVIHRMLRHWDAAGLLVPAHTDPFTGYRSYDPSQLDQLHRIVALRQLGFGIEDIASLMAMGLDTGELARMLGRRRAEVEQEYRIAEARLTDVERRLSPGFIWAVSATSTRAGRPCTRRFLPEGTPLRALAGSCMCAPMSPAILTTSSPSFSSRCTGPASSDASGPSMVLPRSLAVFSEYLVGTLRTSTSKEFLMSFQAYLDAIEERTGQTPRQLVEQAAEYGYDSPEVKAGVILEWLKNEYGLGRGHGMALVHVIKKGPQIDAKHVGTVGSHRDESQTLWLDGKDTTPN